MTSWDGVGWEGGWRLLSYLTKGVARSAVARNLKTFPRSLFSPDGKGREGRRDESEGEGGSAPITSLPGRPHSRRVGGC